MKGAIKYLIGLSFIIVINCNAMASQNNQDVSSCPSNMKQVKHCKDVVIKNKQDVCTNYFVSSASSSKNQNIMYICDANPDYEKNKSRPQCKMRGSCQIEAKH